MDIVVHYQNVSILVAVLPDDDRAGFKPDGFCTVVAPVACDDLIATAIAGADDQRLGNRMGRTLGYYSICCCELLGGNASHS